jgi:hypothetical protein
MDPAGDPISLRSFVAGTLSSKPLAGRRSEGENMEFLFIPFAIILATLLGMIVDELRKIRKEIVATRKELAKSS